MIKSKSRKRQTKSAERLYKVAKRSLTKSKKVTRKKNTKNTKKTAKIWLNSQIKTINYPNYKNTPDMVGKDLRDTVVHGAFMKKINLSGAKLHGTKFIDCKFINVNFDHAFIDAKTEFINCIFKNCKTDKIKYSKGANKDIFDNIFSNNIIV